MDGFHKAEFKRFGNLKDAEAFIGVAYIETSLTNSAQTYEDSPSPSSVSSASSRPSTSASVPAAPSTSAIRFKPYPTTTNKGKAKAEESATKPADQNDWTVAYTDGACQGNGRAGAVAGVGVWYGDNDPRYETIFSIFLQSKSVYSVASIEMYRSAALVIRQTTEPS